MARLPRWALPGFPHLVTLAALPSTTPFHDDADRQAFLAALREASATAGCAVHGYALAADHVHLLLTPPDAAALSAAMQGLGRRYVAAHRRRHGGAGTLWTGRFGATPVPPGDAALEVLVLIDGHAWRDGSASRAADDRTTSARHHLGLQHERWLVDAPGWWSLGNTPFEREAAFRRRLDEGIGLGRAAMWGQASRRSWLREGLDPSAFGGHALAATSAARPVRPRSPGRPRSTDASSVRHIASE